VSGCGGNEVQSGAGCWRRIVLNQGGGASKEMALYRV
jgi:hypothetical protein